MRITKLNRIVRITTLHILRRCHSSSYDKALGEKSFWSKKYGRGQVKTVDWLVPANQIVQYIVSKVEQVPGVINIMDVGCGTSNIPVSVLETVMKPIHMICFDYIQNALQWQMNTIKQTSPANKLSVCSYVTGDVRALPFKDSYFHVIVDKGTLDSLLKDKTKAKTTANLMLSECYRTLNPDGVILQITDEDPDLRIQLLEDCFSHCQINASISYRELETSGYECFMYSISKKVNRCFFSDK